MTVRLAGLLMFAVCTPAVAHRLDEYLQATILSIDKNAVQAELTLTPGVAVLGGVLAEISTAPDGSIPEANRRAYVARVLQDLTLTVDGHRLTPQLDTARFPTLHEMRNGFGEIRITWKASLPPGGRNRKLILENHHQSRIAMYQVNCLVPRDSEITITEQNRNYLQSHYELDYVQAGAWRGSLMNDWISAAGRPSAIAAYLVLGGLALLWCTGRASLFDFF